MTVATGVLEPQMSSAGQAMLPPPAPPATITETGLHPDSLAQLLLKTLLGGENSGTQLAESLRLPYSILDALIQHARVEKLVEVRGTGGAGTAGYRYALTDLGRDRAGRFLDVCRYVGPAPVPLSQYNAHVRRAMAARPSIDRERLSKGFEHLVVSEGMYGQLGPAVNAGKSLFLYGAPGNGKTVVAEGIGRALGSDMHVPHAIDVDGQIITMFDPVSHRSTSAAAAAQSVIAASAHDRRWEQIRRPVVVVGGELTLDMLDLTFNPIAKFYEAPIQVKANGGVFLIDDFGRQLCSPKELLNRWILPLEDRHDFLTIASGKKFEVPFEQLIIFSTNLDPKDLVDDAFLRRIRHKVGIEAPTRDVYEKIFNGVCKRLGMNACPESVDYLYERYYNNGRCPRASDCRDLLEIVQAICRFRRQHVQLNRDLIAEAAATFICEF
jgi:hypothetical protein